MIATTHPVSPEEIVALADGELSTAESAHVSAHIAECQECASLAAQLHDTSQSLSRWTVPPVPPTLDEAVRIATAKAHAGRDSQSKSRRPERNLWRWNLWASGGVRALTAVSILILVASVIWVRSSSPFRRERLMTYLAPTDSKSAMPQQDAVEEAKSVQNATAIMNELRSPKSAAVENQGGGGPMPTERRSGTGDPLAGVVAPAPAPMIAHTVSLTVQVGDVGTARAALEALLARHHGYAAQLTVNTAEGSSRNLQSSLRIPDSELASAIAEMRALGRVETETQSGEEVTQQHADLVARLENSRETEQRLRDLLAQRTGKIDEVLQVEEEIDRVRGQIEEMEAQQKVLEHRVDFATIELQLTEQYREELGPQSASVPMQIRNSFIAGIRHGADTLLGILLFLEESGPTLLIWLAILGVPAFLARRRFRRLLKRQ